MSDYDSDLYGGTPPHQSHSETSAAAANDIKDDARTLRFKVYAHIKQCGAMGATDEEVQVAMGLQLQTEVPRRRELVIRGLVVDSGLKRMTRSNRRATAWVVSGAYIEPEDRKKTTREQLREAKAEIERLKVKVAVLQKDLYWARKK